MANYDGLAATYEGATTGATTGGVGLTTAVSDFWVNWIGYVGENIKIWHKRLLNFSPLPHLPAQP